MNWRSTPKEARYPFQWMERRNLIYTRLVCRYKSNWQIGRLVDYNILMFLDFHPPCNSDFHFFFFYYIFETISDSDSDSDSDSAFGFDS